MIYIVMALSCVLSISLYKNYSLSQKLKERKRDTRPSRMSLLSATKSYYGGSNASYYRINKHCNNKQ